MVASAVRSVVKPIRSAASNPASAPKAEPIQKVSHTAAMAPKSDGRR
jgi:hypothetical protein